MRCTRSYVGIDWSQGTAFFGTFGTVPSAGSTSRYIATDVSCSPRTGPDFVSANVATIVYPSTTERNVEGMVRKSGMH